MNQDYNVTKDWELPIKAGEKFLCIKNVEMGGDPNDIAYFAGRIYESEMDGCITNALGGKDHEWDLSDDFYKYFTRDLHQKTCPTPTSELIERECDALKIMLLKKNLKYGDSATSKGILFDHSPVISIQARINDKLSRLKNDVKGEDEDIIQDLLGYFILLRIAQKQ